MGLLTNSMFNANMKITELKIRKVSYQIITVVIIYDIWPRRLLKKKQPRSQGPLSALTRQKVPWLRLVTCLCIPTQAAQRVGPPLNFPNNVCGGECCAAIQTLFWKGSKLFVRDPTWPVLRLYLNFHEYEMFIERDLCLCFTAYWNNLQQPASD